MLEPLSIADALFTKTQQKILGLLFLKPDSTFYLNEIVRHAGMGKGTIKRELDKMTKAGLLMVKRIGNQKHYQPNPASPVYEELVSISNKTLSIVKFIESKQKEIERLCIMFHVEKLEVFGSATHDGFDASESDIDLLVEFDEEGVADYADNYFGLMDALQVLFNRPVDLVVGSSVSNPYLLESIDRDRIFLYAA